VLVLVAGILLTQRWSNKQNRALNLLAPFKRQFKQSLIHICRLGPLDPLVPSFSVRFALRRIRVVLERHEVVGLLHTVAVPRLVSGDAFARPIIALWPHRAETLTEVFTR